MRTDRNVPGTFCKAILIAPLMWWVAAVGADDRIDGSQRQMQETMQQQGNYGMGMGPGMMGMGGGMMGGGMMGGGMMGGGMMGGGMMGGGMMGGGMMGGPGMMGGGMGGGTTGCPGMMGGMMGMGPLGMLDLTTEQRAKINKLQDEHRKKGWEITGKIMDEQAKLRDLYAADTLDAKKIGAVYGNTARLQQQAVEASVDLSNSIQGVLTKEQRDQLKQWQRGMWRPGMGPGPGSGMMGR